MSIESLLDRPIAFQRVFVSLGAGVTGALLLSQAVYWSRRTASAEGWFYKTQDEWEEETGLTRREQEGALLEHYREAARAGVRLPKQQQVEFRNLAALTARKSA